MMRIAVRTRRGGSVGFNCCVSALPPIPHIVGGPLRLIQRRGRHIPGIKTASPALPSLIHHSPCLKLHLHFRVCCIPCTMN